MTRSHSIWAALLAAIFVFTSLSADADAQRKQSSKTTKKKPAITAKANATALRELMGAFKFGMTLDQVVSVLTKQIKERYAEQISATNDVYQQDKLRKDQTKEIKQLRTNVMEFTGKRGGWDVSIIDDQFVHGTGESMMVYWETDRGRNQRRFFFFHEGKLYKMFIALDTSNLNDDQRNFGFFRTLMENRFGQGEVHDTGLSWRLKDIHVDALDKLAFYSAFCLIVTDPKRQAAVLIARKENAKAPKGRNSVIQSITADDNDQGPGLDERSNVIDSILKK
jgi:hypothetical protein